MKQSHRKTTPQRSANKNDRCSDSYRRPQSEEPEGMIDVFYCIVRPFRLFYESSHSEYPHQTAITSYEYFFQEFSCFYGLKRSATVLYRSLRILLLRFVQDPTIYQF